MDADSMPLPITLRPGVKVNLFLRIGPSRADGYHDLATLFYPLPEPSDELTLSPGAPGSGLRLTCSDPGLANESNTVAKAYRLFTEATGLKPDIAVHLDKRSPTGAGLGGGSADGAAMLGALNGLTQTPLSPKTLAELALIIGADTPFFLTGVPALATGVGEVLTPCPAFSLTGWTLLLICPALHVATPWAYGALDTAREASRTFQYPDRTGPEDPPLSPPLDSLIKNVDHFLTGTLQATMNAVCSARPGREALLPTLENDFEAVVFAAHPFLAGVKETLLAQGAAAALLSGSGASLFGLFRSEDAADKAAHAVRNLGAEAGIETALHVLNPA